MNLRSQLTVLILGLILGLSLEARTEEAKPGFDQVFYGMDVTLLLIDPTNGQIIDANPAATDFYGYDKDKLRTLSIQQINTFTPEQVAAERKLAESEGRNYFIFRHRLADGQIRTVEVFSRPFNFSGKKLLLSLVNDITPGRHEKQDLWHYQQRLEEMVDIQVREIELNRRQQMNALLVGLLLQAIVIIWLVNSIRRRQRLEREREILMQSLREHTHELSRLGEVMAHHLQEPTRRLASFAQRLLNKSVLVNDTDSRMLLEFIDQQARRLSELVCDAQRYLALDHAKVCAGVTADTGAMLRHFVTEKRKLISGSDITLQEPLPKVRLSEKLLGELITILFDNSLRYRHPERVLHINVSATVAGSRAVFRFADNGSGIAPEYREQVFDLFARLVPNSIPGTGMGLALVRKIVQQAGGSIRVEDGLDGGTCIVFDLPVEPTL